MLLNVPGIVPNVKVPLRNVPANARLAPENAPVLKVSGPVAGMKQVSPRPEQPRMLIPVSVELRLRPAKVPVKVPPVLLKSHVLAEAASGNARASKVIKTIRFMTTPRTHVEKPRFVD